MSMETLKKEKCIVDTIKMQWNVHWIKKHKDFEVDIKNTEWEFFSNMIFYIWDGNHRYTGWMEEIVACK